MIGRRLVFTALVYVSGYIFLIFVAICLGMVPLPKLQPAKRARTGCKAQSCCATWSHGAGCCITIRVSVCAACGLYYLAELAEEYTVMTRRIMTWAIAVRAASVCPCVHGCFPDILNLPRRVQAVLVAHVLLLLLEQHLPYAALVRGLRLTPWKCYTAGAASCWLQAVPRAGLGFRCYTQRGVAGRPGVVGWAGGRRPRLRHCGRGLGTCHGMRGCHSGGGSRPPPPPHSCGHFPLCRLCSK